MAVSIVTFTIAPWNTTLIGLCATLCVNGFFLGAYDVGTNVWVMNAWGDRSPPFIQVGYNYLSTYGILIF